MNPTRGEDAQLSIWPAGDTPTQRQRPATPPGLAASARRRTDVDRDGNSRIIWNGEQQAFNVGTLRQAMLVRGFTAETLAQAAAVSRGTIHNVLAGRPTRLRTARRVLEALATTEPTLGLASLGVLG